MTPWSETNLTRYQKRHMHQKTIYYYITIGTYYSELPLSLLDQFVPELNSMFRRQYHKIYNTHAPCSIKWAEPPSLVMPITLYTSIRTGKISLDLIFYSFSWFYLATFLSHFESWKEPHALWEHIKFWEYYIDCKHNSKSISAN